MKFTYDWEFLEDGRTIEPISVGVVAEDGEEYYAIVRDAPWPRIMEHKWLVENVVTPFLPIAPGPFGPWSFRPEMPDFEAVKPLGQIAAEVRAFMSRGLEADEEADLWAFFPAYDHVCLMQLYGSMIDRPCSLPMRTSCLKQEEETLRRIKGVYLPERPVQDPASEHHALHDARHDMALARWLEVV